MVVDVLSLYDLGYLNLKKKVNWNTGICQTRFTSLNHTFLIFLYAAKERGAGKKE